MRSSLGERRQGVTVFVHDLVGDFHRLFEVRIVGQRLKAAASQFSDVELLPDSFRSSRCINSRGRMTPSELPIFLISIFMRHWRVPKLYTCIT